MLPDLEAELSQAWGEHFVAQGMAVDQTGHPFVLRLYVSLTGDTWTIVFVGKENRACIASGGTDWQVGQGA